MNPIEELLLRLIADRRGGGGGRVPLVGVAGAQGSGKSYHCRAFARANPRVAHFSLDDVYRSQAERRHLADATHPLFATRGPPGTHDLDLALRTIETLNRAPADGATPLPRFDKTRDDRMPEPLWPRFTGRPEAILFDGWCLGAKTPPDFTGAPINALEANEDGDGRWRTAVAAALDRYQPFFASFDAIAYLQAPSFEIVRKWRGAQEEETLGRPLTVQEEVTLDRFVQHYERLTRAMLTGGHHAGWIVRLDENHGVDDIERRS